MGGRREKDVNEHSKILNAPDGPMPLSNAVMRVDNLNFEGATRPATGYDEVRWYAAYTSANHEKRVAEQLGVRKVEHFLPVYSSVRQWKDRRVLLEMPLFPGYVFVRIPLWDRLRVVQVPGLARLVGFDGNPVALLDEEIEFLRAGFANGVHARPHPFLTVGRRVRVIKGALAGLTGILLKRKKRARLVVSVKLIQRSMAVEMDEENVEALPL